MMRRACSIAASLIKSSEHLSRAEKNLVRELSLAKQYFDEGTKNSLRKLLTVARISQDENEVTSRIFAYGAFLSLKIKNVEESVQCLSKVTRSPSIIKRSLQVLVYIEQDKLDEAINEIEAVLNDEELLFDSINSCISDEAMDKLHGAIQARQDTHNQMKRFRRIQKNLTQYERRTKATVEEILAMPLVIDPIVVERTFDPEIRLSDRIVKDVPHFLSEKEMKKTD